MSHLPNSQAQFPQRVLMVSPEAFDVKYAINVHMRDAAGKLQIVDRALARRQWQQLKECYEKIGFEVLVVEAVEDFPDLVFCANQSFPFLDRDGKRSALMSRMHARERQGEVPIFKALYEKLGYKIYESSGKGDLEGSGDLLSDFAGHRVFAGYGFRTTRELLAECEKIVGKKFICFELKNPNFYHLDTCLALLNSKTAGYVKSAFTSEGREILKSSFSDLFEIDEAEAKTKLAGNFHCPNGRDVLIQGGCVHTVSALTQRGFVVHELDTSEYLKSGGSVFCMKQMIF